MKNLNEKRWTHGPTTTGWDSIENFMNEVVVWEANNLESFARLARGAGLSNDIPWIVRGQNYIRVFSSMIDEVLCN